MGEGGAPRDPVKIVLPAWKIIDKNRHWHGAGAHILRGHVSKRYAGERVVRAMFIFDLLLLLLL